jgi:hypothetical protein
MANRTISVDWQETGLVGTIGYLVNDIDGDPLRVHTTAGIVENPAGSGIYTAEIPTEWSGRVIWAANGESVDGYFDATTGPSVPPPTVAIAPSVFANSFEYVPVISKLDKVGIRIAAIRNLSTVGPGAGPGTGSTDRGRMFGRVTANGDVLTVKLYADPARAVEICTGTGSLDDLYFNRFIDLTTGANGTHDENARLAVTSLYAGDDPRTADFICFPSFADDADIFPDPSMCASLPGYDTGLQGGGDVQKARGLAIWQVKAVKQLLTVNLPAAIPHLFGGNGLSALVPMDEAEISFPDFRKIANVDQLREAQAALALAMAADANRHLREFRDMADDARERLKQIMEDIRLANEPADVEADETSEAIEGHGGISFGSFERG